MAIVSCATVQRVVAFAPLQLIIAAEPIDRVLEGGTDQHRMRGIMRVVVVIRAAYSEAPVKHILEAQLRAVGENQALEGGGCIRIKVIETRELDGSGVAKVEHHRAGTNR